MISIYTHKYIPL